MNRCPAALAASIIEDPLESEIYCLAEDSVSEPASLRDVQLSDAQPAPLFLLVAEISQHWKAKGLITGSLLMLYVLASYSQHSMLPVRLGTVCTHRA